MGPDFSYFSDLHYEKRAAETQLRVYFGLYLVLGASIIYIDMLLSEKLSYAHII